MKISYNWLQSFFNRKLPQPQELADLLANHAFEAEVVKSQLKNDQVLDIEVTANRAGDCLSYWGIAREIGAILKMSFQAVDYGKRIKPESRLSSQLVKVEVKDKNLCPRYTARVVDQVKVGPSPKWMQERLKANGLRPINNIVDIANYVMLETGQPLHAFDYDKLASQSSQVKKLIIRRAKQGERLVSLDGEKYELDRDILVIADQQKPVCIAGIKGGQGPGVDSQSQRIVLEAANFNYQAIRRASRKLRLVTDASWRFEHGVDPNLTLPAIDMAACLVQELAQGKVLKGYLDFYPEKVRAGRISLDPDYLKSLLGTGISSAEIISILKRLDLSAVKKGGKIQVSIPSRRPDLQAPEDLIEEVARLYGFEKIPSQLPSTMLILPEDNQELVYQEKIKDILSGAGYAETYNYSFVSLRDLQESGLGENQAIEVENPISREQQYLRPALMVNLIKNLKANQRFFEQIRLFEAGKVFYQGKEIKRLAGILSLAKSAGMAEEFYRLKGMLDALFEKLGLVDIWYDDAVGESQLVKSELFHPEQRAEIKSGSQLLGWLGQLSPEAAVRFGLKFKAAGFELDFAKLANLANQQKEYLPVSKYPAVVRDLALITDLGVKVIEVMNLIHAAGGRLIRDIDLFDIYQGDNLPQGKKSLAFRIIYQSDKRTLTDQEVNRLHQKIIKALEEEGGWEVRR